ncbi:hypothetical protein A7K50_04740 [Dehalobacter sp. MCB1]|nr:hypothetical protein A7K50_04740 [Dehalobacter sp. MCB1]TCX55320.1 hypothetical protein C1I38_03500 [Dehalobacter sp. 12DCB1]
MNINTRYEQNNDSENHFEIKTNEIIEQINGYYHIKDIRRLRKYQQNIKNNLCKTNVALNEFLL